LAVEGWFDVRTYVWYTVYRIISKVESEKLMNINFCRKKIKKMEDINLSEIIERSVEIRKFYHNLERKYHNKEWTVEEDALAFLTDAGLVGRLTMSQQERWPINGDTKSQLEHKLGECIWWIIILAERMNIDISEALKNFLSTAKKNLKD
jgi:NTP pyrophosphatase (non-canonical NTP hydrolase)